MRGTLLDPKTGRPQGDPPGLADVPGKGVVMNYLSPEVDGERMLHRAPDYVKANLAKASQDSAFNPRGSMQAWSETLYVTLADGAVVTAAAEATFVPIFTLPANYLYPGRLMKWTVMGRLSSAITTPGTFTLRLTYSATGLGAVVVCSSGAFAPSTSAAATNLTFMSTWWAITRSNGTAGAMMGWGKTEWTDYNEASLAALTGNMGMDMSPQSAPATVAVDTTVARALNPTYQPSLGTASMTCHAAILEALT
jgi:hypothetical protein